MAKNTTSIRQYRCVYCLEPCESLYYQYGGPQYSTSLLSSPSASSRTANESSSNIAQTESEKESSASSISSSLSSTSSVFKLNRCTNCKHIVDPYCEREWLLILFDLILLRTEAYRHILCNDEIITTSSGWYRPLIRVAAMEQNQQQLKQQQQQQRCNDSPFSSLINIIYQYHSLVIDIMICCIARVYIQFQSTDGYAQSLQDLINTENLYDLQYAHSVVFSVTKSFLINLLISIVGQCTYIYMILFLVGIIHHTTSSGGKEKEHTMKPTDQYCQTFQHGMLVKSILWPIVASHLATIWVGVWENSQTTRILGCTVLPVIYQCMSLYHTLEATTRGTTIGCRVQPYNDARQKTFDLLIAIKTSSLIVTAMVARSVVIMLIAMYCNIINPVCPGLQIVIDIKKLNATICLA